MEHKTFNLLSKMYSEFSDFRTEAKQRLESIEGHVLGIENKQFEDSKALFDGYKQTHENMLRRAYDLLIVSINSTYPIKYIKREYFTNKRVHT